jgi:cytidine deaminase
MTTMNDRQALFDVLLDKFPSSVRDDLQSILSTGGMLAAGRCAAVIDALKISTEELMLRLLPIARSYADASVSNFEVGAVAKARLANRKSEFALFLGANMEFADQSLSQAIHAEQSAVMNAWHGGASGIDYIAVSAAPCGRCRQFLFELCDRDEINVVLPASKDSKFRRISLSELLPQAFGPKELGLSSGLMGPDVPSASIHLKAQLDDPLVVAALSAARQSYAPYTRNFAGCSVQAGSEKVYAGRYAENAAFNPSLSPLHAAIVGMNMDNPSAANRIKRAVLVEKPTTISQRGICELLLNTLAPGVGLEYFEAG